MNKIAMFKHIVLNRRLESFKIILKMFKSTKYSRGTAETTNIVGGGGSEFENPIE